MKTLCFLLLAILTPAFAEDVKPANINIAFLCQTWTHSREEQQQGDGMQIYRPSAFKQFSPSRFRMQYVFAKDGACKWMFLSPDDAHHFKDGKWKIDDHVLQIVKEKATESFQVIELSKDLLKMKLLDNAK